MHADLRKHFPIARKWSYLDHAAIAGLPDVSIAAFQDYATNIGDNGIAAINRWVDRHKEVRRLAAKFINAPAPQDVCFITSTTFGIGIVAEGFPWKPGDNVVTAAEEFPSNIYPWMNLKDRGVETRLVPSRGSRVSIDDIRDAMNDRTRVLAISAVEFCSGYRNDLAALGELCRSRGVFFFVDAIQMLGMIPMDVQALGIDAVAADSHKWLLGPEGAGFAYVKREWAERMHTVMVGFNSVVNPFDFSKLDFTQKPNALRWEGGAYNTGGIHAMGASLQLQLEHGLENTWAEIEAISDYLCEKSKSAGLTVWSSRKPGEKSGMVLIEKPGADSGELMKRCREAGVIVNNRRGRLRVSPHAYNNRDDIDRFIDAVR